jgi:UDP-N-acetylglucosamine 4,6-dehydratase
MIPRDDAKKTIGFEDQYVVQPDFEFWQKRYSNDIGEPVPEDFEYNSRTNPWVLTIKEMKEMIEEL